MSNEALVAMNEIQAIVNNKQFTDIFRGTVAPGLTDPQLHLFLYQCSRLGVNALDGMIVPQLRKATVNGHEEMRMTLQATIDYLRAVGEASGEFAGIDEPEFVEGDGPYPVLAKVTVYRSINGTVLKFVGVARWSEFYPGDGGPGFMYRSKPHLMLAKCAEAQARRLGWPKQLKGLYVAEELQKSDVIDVVDEPTPKTYNVRPAQPAAEAPKETTGKTQKPTDAAEPERKAEPAQKAPEPGNKTKVTGPQDCGRNPFTCPVASFVDRKAICTDGKVCQYSTDLQE